MLQSRSTCTVLQAIIGEPPICYDMVVLKFKGVKSAIFAVFNPADNTWEGIDLPLILRNDPEQLKRFTCAMSDNGYTLLHLPTPATLQ